MAASTGPVLAIGAITLANNVIVHSKPLADQAKVIVGTGITAVALGLLEQASPGLAVGLAWLALVTLLLTRIDPKVPAPLESIANWYNAK